MLPLFFQNAIALARTGEIPTEQVTKKQIDYFREYVLRCIVAASRASVPSDENREACDMPGCTPTTVGVSVYQCNICKRFAHSACDKSIQLKPENVCMICKAQYNM